PRTPYSKWPDLLFVLKAARCRFSSATGDRSPGRGGRGSGTVAETSGNRKPLPKLKSCWSFQPTVDHIKSSRCAGRHPWRLRSAYRSFLLLLGGLSVGSGRAGRWEEAGTAAALGGGGAGACVAGAALTGAALAGAEAVGRTCEASAGRRKR